jgi:hypothetical protein
MLDGEVEIHAACGGGLTGALGEGDWWLKEDVEREV